MSIIQIEEEKFFELIEQVVLRISEKHNLSQDRWVDGEEAMRRLRIKSPTTLQKLRDEGKIVFSQPSKKIILYNAQSIDTYIEDNIPPKI